MRKTDSCNGRHASFRPLLLCLLLCMPVSGSALAAELHESLSGFYAREGNDGSPAQAAGNNTYIRFYPDRWVAMMFLPWPYASEVDAQTIVAVFDRARAQVDSSAYLRGSFDRLQQNATLHIERYGYLEDRILFECGSLAPCSIRLGEDYLDLIKPGVINEHIIRYRHVASEPPQ